MNIEKEIIKGFRKEKEEALATQRKDIIAMIEDIDVHILIEHERAIMIKNKMDVSYYYGQHEALRNIINKIKNQ